MNRIILIGNGFDLAHGMPTSYKEFIDDFWSEVCKKISSIPEGGSEGNDDFYVKRTLFHFKTELNVNSFTELENGLELKRFEKFEVKNKFLEIITQRSDLQNWVDIENEYYLLLLKSINNSAMDYNGQFYNFHTLNSDFARVKTLLKEYLQKYEDELKLTPKKNKVWQQIFNKSYSEIRVKELSRKAINIMIDRTYDYWVNPNLIDKDDATTQNVSRSIAEHLRKKHNVNPDISLVRRFMSRGSGKSEFEQKPDNITFLNFNYTSTAKSYAHLDSRIKLENDIDSSIDVRTIHIHGSLNDHDENPIIFGYGDELDDDYKRIEKLNDNSYLENIKSIKYLETDNYKKLLEFIESDEYQVFIFGHSCGTSDRTLLNTLFEHDNCASIKPFYHQRDDGTDNYSDIVRNISRNFNNKIKMRDRVVNKTYCSPLLET
jgi:hypothetical protein